MPKNITLGFFVNTLPVHLISFFELSFVAFLLLLLHSLRKHIGLAPFYLSLGSILIFNHIIAGAEHSHELNSTILLTPFMMALLIVYALDGTIHAQRLTVGAAGTSAIFFYLSYITSLQSRFASESSLIHKYFYGIFDSNHNAAVASMATMLLELLILPTMFQFFRNRSFGVFSSVTAAFLSSQVLDSTVYTVLTNPWDENTIDLIRELYLSRCLPMIWLGSLAALYLRLNNYEFKSDTKSPLDYIGALFQSYTPERMLKKHVREWDDRFEMFFNNSQNLIFLVQKDGTILDCNNMCSQVMGLEAEQINGLNINQLQNAEIIPDTLSKIKDKAIPWKKIWLEAGKNEEKRSSNIWMLQDSNKQCCAYDFLLKRINNGKVELGLFSGRDITTQTKLQFEKENLHLQLQHSQRLESIGQLAGGVAHDFNNLLHSIQGNLDSLKKHCPPEKTSPITNINAAVERASNLTGQLLGFARKGKYQVEVLDIAKVMNDVNNLFEPSARKKVRLQLLVHPSPMIIHCDKTQIEQALLNLLINAKDALEGKERAKIIFRAEPAKEQMPGWSEAPSDASPQDYACIRCKDNGTGIEESVIEKIFDPFFTTKDIGKGTGMGLAMVYGTIQNHNGWLHMETQVGKGTEFFIFLPLEQAN